MPVGRGLCRSLSLAPCDVQWLNLLHLHPYRSEGGAGDDRSKSPPPLAVVRTTGDNRKLGNADREWCGVTLFKAQHSLVFKAPRDQPW